MIDCALKVPCYGGWQCTVSAINRSEGKTHVTARRLGSASRVLELKNEGRKKARKKGEKCESSGKTGLQVSGSVTYMMCCYLVEFRKGGKREGSEGRREYHAVLCDDA